MFATATAGAVLLGGTAAAAAAAHTAGFPLRFFDRITGFGFELFFQALDQTALFRIVTVIAAATAFAQTGNVRLGRRRPIGQLERSALPQGGRTRITVRQQRLLMVVILLLRPFRLMVTRRRRFVRQFHRGRRRFGHDRGSLASFADVLHGRPDVIRSPRAVPGRQSARVTGSPRTVSGYDVPEHDSAVVRAPRILPGHIAARCDRFVCFAELFALLAFEYSVQSGREQVTAVPFQTDGVCRGADDRHRRRRLVDRDPAELGRFRLRQFD